MKHCFNSKNRKKECIVFICTARGTYVRNVQMLTALRKHFEVIEIVSEKSSYFQRMAEVMLRFFCIRCTKQFRMVYLGFLGQPLFIFIKVFCWKPIILDAFISVYDTLCFDRKDFHLNSIVGRLAFCLDFISLCS